MLLTGLPGRLAGRWRWPVIAVWALAIGASLLLAPRLPQLTRGGGFDLPASESWQAADAVQNQFGGGYRRSVRIIYSHPEWPVGDERFRGRMEESLKRVGSLAAVRGINTWYDDGLPNMVSPDGSTTFAEVSFFGQEKEVQPLVPELRRLAADPALEVHVIGGPAFDYDLEATSKADLLLAEKIGLPVVLAILALVFGSLVAMVLPLALGLASVSVTLALLYLLSRRLDLSIFVINMVTMVGLGLGIDYSLFMVSRFREEMGRQRSVAEAVRATLATAGKAVVFSAASVFVGLAMMVPFSIVFLRSLGVGGALVAVMSALVALTLLPALQAVLGRRIDAGRLLPRSGRQTESAGALWSRWAGQVMKRPWLFLVLSATLLLVLAWPAREMAAGVPTIEDLTPGSDSRQGVDLFGEKWGLGELSPLYVVFEADTDDISRLPAFMEGLAAFEQQLARDPRVARVDSLADYDPGLGEEVSPDKLAQLAQGVLSRPGGDRLLGLRDGRVVTVAWIYPEALSPAEGRQLVRDLRQQELPAIPGFSGLDVKVGGGAAEAADFTDAMRESFPLLLGAVLLISYLVLLLLFRSLILPLKAIIMNLLSVTATYGVLVAVFQKGWGSGVLGFTPPEGIIPFVPVLLFAMLFGISMDYEVFLLSRIREEYLASGDNQAAVARGLARTGRVITTAALIMIAVFGSFATAESIVIKEIGIGLAVAIFLDATVVRVALMPAAMRLLGRWNWYLPGWLDRLLPRLTSRGRDA